ncbi:hypothetical protein VK792_03635 [Mesobacterium sp. TK19101]|uniref:Uncharacterized protein n=1 Tax=Mesobacterium hydrothermale TaxID=3111907 RepID=A0ABU6HFA4_9RHOB|nr:hypothetical protein [Mesobacterium sp. TK19101]MEC3860364.1 hypothetical protein [Mesobacterium sp. TK19101]
MGGPLRLARTYKGTAASQDFSGKFANLGKLFIRKSQIRKQTTSAKTPLDKARKQA